MALALAVATGLWPDWRLVANQPIRLVAKFDKFYRLEWYKVGK